MRGFGKLLAGTLAGLLLSLGVAQAQLATLLPNGEQTFVDANGQPYAAGTVGFYVPGTLTPKATWKDAGGTMLNTNPVTLDSAGRAIIYGSGIYRQIVKDVFSNTIWDQLTQDIVSGSGISPAMYPVVSASSLAAARTAFGLNFGQNVVIDANSNLAAGRLPVILTADKTLASTDNGSFFILGGTTSRTITFPSTLAVQFSVTISNNSSVPYTLTPGVGAALLGGNVRNATSIALNPNETVQATADGNGNVLVALQGTVYNTQVVTGAVQAYLATGNGITYFRSNAGSAMADTLPTPSATVLAQGTVITVVNQDASAVLVITPAAATINAAGTLTLQPGMTAIISSNGTNYFATVVNKGSLTAGTVLLMSPYAVGTTQTQAHGLGTVPKIVTGLLTCLVNDAGYTAGQTLYFDVPAISSADTGQLSLEVTATNLVLRTSSANTIAVPHATTHVNTAITAADWSITITGYRLN